MNLTKSRKVVNEYISDGLKYVEPVAILSTLVSNEPSKLMYKKDYKEYLQLPDILTVYRGCSLDELKEGFGWPLGISWSLDKNIAEFFAYRYGGKGMCVLEAVVQKKNVRYYTNGRREKEVMIFPGFVEKPHIISKNVTDFDCYKFHEMLDKQYS